MSATALPEILAQLARERDALCVRILATLHHAPSGQRWLCTATRRANETYHVAIERHSSTLPTGYVLRSHAA